MVTDRRSAPRKCFARKSLCPNVTVSFKWAASTPTMRLVSTGSRRTRDTAAVALSLQ